MISIRDSSEEVIEELKKKHNEGIDIEPILKRMYSWYVFGIAEILKPEWTPNREVLEKRISDIIKTGR